MLFLFKAKAKEKKEQKAGEHDDTIPPEYRLTPELVSFSYLHCRALCLTLYFITERERTWGKQTKLVFNQRSSPWWFLDLWFPPLPLWASLFFQGSLGKNLIPLMRWVSHLNWQSHPFLLQEWHFLFLKLNLSLVKSIPLQQCSLVSLCSVTLKHWCKM